MSALDRLNDWLTVTGDRHRWFRWMPFWFPAITWSAFGLIVLIKWTS